VVYSRLLAFTRHAELNVLRKDIRFDPQKKEDGPDQGSKTPPFSAGGCWLRMVEVARPVGLN